MDLVALRGRIDDIDDSLVKLICERMRVSGDIARYKSQNGLAVRCPDREREKMDDVLGKTDEGLRRYVGELFTLIIELSCAYQETIL